MICDEDKLRLALRRLVMHRYSFAAILFSLFVSLSGSASSATSTELHAKGFADDRGGRGGKIVRVTNLEAEGPGSLQAALKTRGSRIIIFEVGGVLDLKKKSLVISEPFVTIAGQTAPSPGITIIRGPVYIKTHDVLIQHIRVRPGDAGEPKRSGWEPDGISTSGGTAYNVVIDHCSVSWATDENLSASGPRTEGPEATSHRITFSNCIISECLSKSTHKKGEHSKGSLIHDFCQDIAIIGNLYAHNVRRNPYFKAYTTGVIVNNVIYNPGRAAIQLDFADPEWRGMKFKPKNCRVSIVGNVLVHGASTEGILALVARRGDVYLEDNLAFKRNGKPAPLVSGNINRLKEKPVWPEWLRAIPSNNTVEYVIKHAGARPKDRDDTDKRIIKEFEERKGRVINSQDDVGGYPKVEMTKRPLDIPDKNVDHWLARMAKDLE